MNQHIYSFFSIEFIAVKFNLLQSKFFISLFGLKTIVIVYIVLKYKIYTIFRSKFTQYLDQTHGHVQTKIK